MDITITISPKEITDLVFALQDRHKEKVDLKIYDHTVDSFTVLGKSIKVVNRDLTQTISKAIDDILQSN